MAGTGFDDLDFAAFHRDELPRRIAAGHGALAARALAKRGALAFRVADEAWTYRPAGPGVEILAGDAAADTVIELDREAWQGLVHDYESAPGLLYAGRVRCVRGDAMGFVLWEPALRALYQGRPVYDVAEALVDEAGHALDASRVFSAQDDPDAVARFLRSAGYAFVRGLFDDDEIAAFRRGAERLRAEALKGDRVSWWAKDATGGEVLCRVTRAKDDPALATLYGEPRLHRIIERAEPGLVPRQGEGNGVTVIFKNPGVTEGLSDLPWHRDCGMGGHAVICPVVIASLYLTPANPETGELVFLPGSHRRACGYMDASAQPPRAVHFDARPGDVSLHYGDVMHAAPPPRSAAGPWRISAITGYARPDARPHRGQRSYNDVLHQREDGQIEHLAAVAKRA